MSGTAKGGRSLQGEDARIFKEKVTTFSNVSYDIAGFLEDIQVELQNTLLGSFFDRRLPVRQPKDDSVLVLTSEDQLMIERVKTYLDEQIARNGKCT